MEFRTKECLAAVLTVAFALASPSVAHPQEAPDDKEPAIENTQADGSEPSIDELLGLDDDKPADKPGDKDPDPADKPDDDADPDHGADADGHEYHSGLEEDGEAGGDPEFADDSEREIRSVNTTTS